MNSNPTSRESDARRLAYVRLLRADPPDWVPPHCLAVEALATAMCDCAESRGLTVDHTVVQTACLLHDIGRSVTQDVRHAGVGSELLRKDGIWDPRVVLAVERHTGGGIDADEAAHLGLPVRDYTPRTLEERIVCHADNLYSGARRLGLAEVTQKYRAKGLDLAATRIVRLHEDLCKVLGTDLEALQPARLPTPP